MAPLGALSQAWVSAEASLPLGWQTNGLYRFGDLWVALAEGPEFDDYASGSGRYAAGVAPAERRTAGAAGTDDGMKVSTHSICKPGA